MALTDEQMQRLEELSSKGALSDAEMSEMEGLDTLAAPPEPAQEAAPAEEEQAWFSPKSKSGTALRSGGRGLSYGFLPALSGAQAAQQALYAMTAGGVGEMVAPDAGAGQAAQEHLEALGLQNPEELSPTKAILQTYAKRRDEMRRELAEGEAANPALATTSEIAGGIVAPGPKATAITKLGRFGKAAGRAVQGVKSGAPMAVGYSETDIIDPQGEVHLENIPKLAGDAAKTAAIMAPGGVVFGALGDKASRVLSKWLEARANKAALNAVGLEAGIVNKLAQEGIEDVPEALALGKAIREEPGLITALASPATIQQRAKAMIQSWAPVQRQAVEEAQAAANAAGRPFSFSDAAAAAEKALEGSAGIIDPLQRETFGKALSNINKVREVAGIPGSAPEGFKIANQMRQTLQRTANWKADAPAAMEAQQNVARAFKKSLEQQMEAVAPEATNMYQTANRKIALGKTIDKLGGNAGTRELARKELGLRGTMMAGDVAQTLTPMFGPAAGWAAGALTGAGESFLRQRLGSIGALAQGALAPRVAGMFAAAGPAAYKLASQYLSKPDTKAQQLKAALGANPQRFGRFAPALQEAAAKGDQDLATMDFILSEQNPEYRQMREDLSDEP